MKICLFSTLPSGRRRLRIVSGLLLASCGASALAGAVAAQPAGGADDAPVLASLETDFDASWLMGSASKAADLSRFRRGNQIGPGVHELDVYLNDQWLMRRKLRFETAGDGAELCVDRALLTQLSVDLGKLSEGRDALLARADAGNCLFLGEIVSQGTAIVDMNRLRLDVGIPSAALVRLPRGYVDPADWDRGVPAALLQYRANLFHTDNSGLSDTSFYLGTTAGLNLGGWVFRHDGSFVAANGKTSYHGIATYVSRDVPALQARLTLGDSFTDGSIFDSVGIRGIQLTSDDRMLPDSRRGYAPVIRGVALGNARVSIEQNGVLLYETTVAAGPFEIDDLFPTGFGADLKVTVTEANGQATSFTVPFASAPQLVRKGRVRFSLAAGELRTGFTGPNMLLARGSAQYGLSDRLTLYGGLTAAEGYGSALVGAAANTPIGAFSVDLTAAGTDTPFDGTRWGHSLRLGYSGFIPSTRTAISVATFMGSSSGYWDLRSAAALWAAGDFHFTGQEKQRVQASISQDFGRLGQVYLSGSSAEHWEEKGRLTTAQIGYSTNLRVRNQSLGFNLNLSRLWDEKADRTDNRLMASLTVPLGSGSNRPTATASYIHDDHGGSAQQLSIQGSALQDSRLGYGAFLDHSDGRVSGGGSATYRGRAASYSASGSFRRSNYQASLGVSGGVVLHAGGITFAPELGETVAIVEAKGAQGARVLSGMGVRVDGAGYAVVPFVSPYRMNDVGIDPQGLPQDTQFETTSQLVAPTSGAVVLLKYRTRMGRSGLIDLRMADGSAAPFGAAVRNAAGEELGLVGQSGRAFVSGVEDQGSLLLDLGQGGTCAFDYRLPARGGPQAGYTAVSARCEVVAGAEAQSLDPAGKTIGARP